jgi:DNA-binding transcriptional LysR family regulator
MTLDQMRYFLEAAKFQHVGKAAKSAAISPSAISSAVSTLESELDCRLFDRQGKTIRLTEHGLFLKRQIEKIFDDISAIESALKSPKSSMTGSYRLGASPFLMSQYLASTWFSLQKVHPALVGELSSVHTARLISDVLSGSTDLALCFSPLRHPDLKQYDLHTGQLKIALRKGHPIFKDKNPLKKLASYPATIHKASPGVDLCENHPVFEKYDILPKVACLFDNDEVAVKSLLLSDSWALLPDVVIKAYAKTIASLPLPKDWDAPYTISVVIRSHRDTNNVLKSVREKLAIACQTART